MLSASRRSLLASSRQLLSYDSLATFVVGCSKDLERDWRQFSTSSATCNAPRTRPTKEKIAAKLEKLERKRSERAVKAMAAGVRTAEARVTTLEKGLELEEKRIASEELVEGLEPFTEDQLEGFFQGLLGAMPEELALPALESSSNLLLVDPNADVESREERIRALEDRLESLGGGEELSEEGVSGGDLSERLLARRAGKLPAPTVEDSTPAKDLSQALTPTRRILDTLDSLVPLAGTVAPGEAGSEATNPVTTGIAVQSEFRDLILSSAEDGDIEGVKKGLNLLRRSIPSAEITLLTEVMALYGNQSRTRDALELAKFARENSLPMSVTTHHYLLSSLLPLHPTLAIQHLHSLEAVGHTPLLETYTLVIRTLLSPSSPAHLVSRAWDLYAHTRLVSHPTPDVALFATMIRSCSRGPHPSPERAIDLFTEMTSENGLPPSQEAYNGVIRACAREGTQEYYFEALRFMRQMLDANVAPTRHTFHAILEGAKRHGDLARARWMLVKMIGVGGDAAPDANSLGLVFQTYAAYKPPVPQGNRRMRTEASTAPPPAIVAPASTRTVDEVRSAPSSSSYSEEASKTDAIVDLLGESSLFYPGPLPQTPDELLAEAKNLMTQCIGLDALSPPSSNSPNDSNSPPFISTIFPLVVPSTFLFNSYLNVLSSHGPIDDAVAFFKSAFTRLQVPKNRFTFERIMTRCETAKNRELGERVAREVFAEWKAWEAQASEIRDEVVEESVAEDKTDEESLKSGSQAHKSGRNISLMWASMIRNLARNYSDTEALSLLQSFITTYPPLNLLWSAHSARDASRALPTQPSPMRLSTIAYPETTCSTPLDRPPYILFDQVRLLHLRLAGVEDKKAMAKVKAICKAYEGALRAAKEYEAGKAQKKKEVKGNERKK